MATPPPYNISAPFWCMTKRQDIINKKRCFLFLRSMSSLHQQGLYINVYLISWILELASVACYSRLCVFTNALFFFRFFILQVSTRHQIYTPSSCPSTVFYDCMSLCHPSWGHQDARPWAFYVRRSRYEENRRVLQGWLRGWTIWLYEYRGGLLLRYLRSDGPHRMSSIYPIFFCLYVAKKSLPRVVSWYMGGRKYHVTRYYSHVDRYRRRVRSL